ncbi:G protein-coupled glucose receptor regulating Gpa2-domain-containing protein [Cladorrhinum sp. PSN332]|nr:G protein-coupled glucose receptor regulating Gpa2-domain-containing protein [Cladorrhinum sp. PSN332]
MGEVRPIYSVNSENHPSTLAPLPWVLTHGLASVTTFGFLSFLSALWLFCFLTYQFVGWQVGGSPDDDHGGDAERTASTELDFDVDGFLVPASRDPPGGNGRQIKQKRNFFQRLRDDPPNQFFILIYNLLLADFQQAMGFLLNVAWLSKHGIYVETATCWVQGWFLSTGNLASSAFICGIGIHTYLGVVKNYRPPTGIFYSVILFLWFFVYGTTLLGVIITRDGAPNGYGLYARAGAWCWINSDYQDLRLYLHYLWIFIALALTAVVYLVIVVRLYIRNKNSDKDSKQRPESPPSRSFELPPPATSASTSTSMTKSLDDVHSADNLNGNKAAITTFLLYPLIYIICTAPLAICRLAAMAEAEVPLSCYCLAGSMVASAGWLDVLLYATTRRSIIFSGEKPPSQDTGLETFAFIKGTLRTPKREFGNVVFVDGGKEGAAEVGGLWGWVRGWWTKGRKDGSLSRQGSLRGAAMSTKIKSHENVGGGISLRGFGMGDDGVVVGNAIQCETTMSVTVEDAEEKEQSGEAKRVSWYTRGVRVVN